MSGAQTLEVVDQRRDLESSQPNPIDKTTRQLELEIKLEEEKAKTAQAKAQATVQEEQAKAETAQVKAQATVQEEKAKALATALLHLAEKRLTQEQYDQAVKDWRDLTSGRREQAGYLCFWLSTGSWSNALPPSPPAAAQHLHRSQRTPG
jgi:small-conductance mechanosensitive channel